MTLIEIREELRKIEKEKNVSDLMKLPEKWFKAAIRLLEPLQSVNTKYLLLLSEIKGGYDTFKMYDGVIIAQSKIFINAVERLEEAVNDEKGI